MGERVAVLGASPKPERYANRAQRMLRSHGHVVIPVNPAFAAVEGLATVPLEALPVGLDTVTVYLGARRMLPLVEQLAGRAPGRIILNPGADDPEVVRALEAAGMRVQLACTLVLLESGRYEAA
ncbi:MAG: CoA-binding protein [Pseudomonadales bacterium]|jgi:predicted CoA-binding protein|nr:CoA-binding protein [Pseudomonadales bacterium]